MAIFNNHEVKFESSTERESLISIFTAIGVPLVTLLGPSLAHIKPNCSKLKQFTEQPLKQQYKFQSNETYFELSDDNNM